MFKESIRVAKFAKKLKEYREASDEVAKERALIYLNHLLGSDGGILTKALQYMGTKNVDLMQNHHASSTFALSPKQIKNILDENFPNNQISEISAEGFLASVGQVNIAKFHDQKVAIKTQYPGIKNKFKDQLRLLNLLSKTGEQTKLKKWGMELGSYQANFENLIDSECDYLNEVKNIKRWNQYEDKLGYSFFKSPKVLDDLSAKEIYVQEYIDGQSIDDVSSTWSNSDKKILSEHILKSYLGLLFHFQEIQGDTNHGNFLFDKAGCVYFIDLGQTIDLSSSDIPATLYHAIKSSINREEVDALGFFKGLGFDEIKLKPIQAQLSLLMETLLEPLTSDFAMKMCEWKYQEKIDLILGENKWWFRSSGGVDFFNFMKSFMGIKNLLIKLDQEIFCKKILKEFFEQNLFSDFKIPVIEIEQRYQKQYKASYLQVLVVEGDLEKVRVTLPFHALFELDEFVDIDVKEKIESQGHDMKSLIRNALEDGGQPKKLFQLQNGSKNYSIELLA